MKKKVWIPAAAVLAVLVLLVLVWGSRQNSGSAQPGGMVFDPSAEEYHLSMDPEENQVDGITIPGYGDIYFPAGETNVQITLYNPEENDCLFRFELYVDEESEPIASTELIEPGKAVRSVALSHALEAGEYALNIKVLPYSADDYTPLNNALVYTRLYVLAGE